ncbi:hypothetical protein ISD41_18360 [Pseudomonas aeruginosa]|nr:hypothetical protein [Pseudomonas aeruginosa]
MIINISDVWDAAADNHTKYLAAVIESGLKLLSNSTLDRQIYQFIIDNIETINGGTASDLKLCINDYNLRFGSGLLRACAAEKLKIIFDYSDFSKKSGKPWTAYNLCMLAKYQVCSYCQLVFAGTCLPDEENQGYRPPIDHYYGKAEYPFLALTLSNFVPCCEKCNGSQMKGMIDFSDIPHLNPLLDEETIDFVLTTQNPDNDSFTELISLSLPKSSYLLTLRVKKNEALSKASIRTFQLKSRYKDYSGQAYHLAKVMRGMSARLDMHREILECETSIEDYLEFEPEDYKTVPYGKARICIAKQFGALPD